MMSEIEVTALRDDIARRLAEEEQQPIDPAVQDDEIIKAARRGRLRMAIDVLTHILSG